MSAFAVLVVASEIYPLIKTGGLADVAGALPGALAREDVAVRTLMPGYPAVLAKLDTARARARLRRSVRRAGAGARRPQPPASTSSSSTRRISTTGRATPISARTAATGATTPIASPRWRASAPTSPKARSPASRPTSSTPTTGRRALAPAYLHYDGGRAAGHDRHHPQPRLSGPFPRGAARAISACPRTPCRSTASNISSGVGYLEGGPAVRRPHHHGFADLCARDHDAGIRHGARRPAARARQRRRRHRQRHRRHGVEPRHRPEPRRRTTAPCASTCARATRRRCSSGSASPSSYEPPLFGVVSRLTSQKGLDLLLAALPDFVARGAQLALLGSGEKALEEGFADAALAHKGAVGCAFGYDEALVASHAGGLRFHPRAVPLRALRAHPALRPALRRDADRRARRRARRHGHRRQRGGDRRRRRHRHPILAARRAGSVLRARARARASIATSRRCGACVSTACAPTFPGAAPPSATPRSTARLRGSPA